MYLRIIIFLSLFGLWAMFSAYYFAWNWWLGISASAFIVLLAINMRLITEERWSWKFGYKLPIYIIWLIRQVVMSNLDVSRRILSPKLPIDPQEIYVQSKRKYNLGTAIYSNSITLTPGTVSIDVDDQGVRVHALSERSLEMITSGELEEKLKWLEE